MEVVRLEDASPSLFTAPVVTVGFFDGFHLGHQTLLSRLVGWAASRGSDAVVLTFPRHPQAVIAHTPPLHIMSPEHRLIWFRRLMVDAVVLMQFNDELASMSAERFIEEILLQRIGATGILFGWDSRFGAHGRGNADFVENGPWNIEVRRCPPVEVNGVRPSSTLIRRLILQGRLNQAHKLLGHFHTLWGVVVPGHKIGRRIGIPTINLKTEAETLPPEGVYGGRAVLPDGRWHWALINIGPRPTFGSHTTSIEAHLLGFDGELYGQKIELEIHRFIRKVRPFPNAAALKRQIERDINSFLSERRLGRRS